MTRERAIEGAAFLTGLAGASALLVATAVSDSRSVDAELWTRVLPLGVLAYYWPVCMPDAELRRRAHWPTLLRYPLETATVMLAVAFLYAEARGSFTFRFWGFLGGSIAAVACWIRGHIESERRGVAFDRSLGQLSRYASLRRWLSNVGPRFPGKP